MDVRGCVLTGSERLVVALRVLTHGSLAQLACQLDGLRDRLPSLVPERIDQPGPPGFLKWTRLGLNQRPLALRDSSADHADSGARGSDPEPATRCRPVHAEAS
jgi:hypothetical protein